MLWLDIADGMIMITMAKAWDIQRNCAGNSVEEIYEGGEAIVVDYLAMP